MWDGPQLISSQVVAGGGNEFCAAYLEIPAEVNTSRCSFSNLLGK